MSYLLDTDTCSAYLKQQAGLFHRFIQHSGRLYVSTISLAELYVWAYGRPNPTSVLPAIEAFRKAVVVLDYGPEAAEAFGKLRALLKRRGIGVSPPDLLIASAAIAHDLILVTHNTSHFVPIPGLRLDDWLTP